MAEFHENTERAEFEAWYRKGLGFRPDMLYRRDAHGSMLAGYYIRDWTQGQWEGWLERAKRASGVALREVPVTLGQVEELARTMWKGEPVPGRVLRFGAAVLGLADAAGVPGTPETKENSDGR